MMRSETIFKQTEIGMIPQEWKVKTIDEIKSRTKSALAMGPFGSNIKKEFFVKEGVPVIRGNNLTSYRFLDEDFVYLTEEKADELRSSNCHPGDIVITHRGTLGQVGLIPRKSRFRRYVISQSGMKLSCDESQAISEYVFCFLKSPRGQRLLLRNTSQTGVPAIAQPLTSLKNISLPVPDINEQKRIAKVFEDLNDKIDLLEKQNKILEEIGKTLFKRWFIDFEFPNEGGKPYKSSGGEMIDSELKKIPKGWRIGKLVECVSVLKGCSYKSDDLNRSEIALVTLKSINRGGGFNQEGYKEYTGGYDESQVLGDGEIVVAQTDLTQKAEIIGRPAIVTSSKYSKLVASLDLQIVRSKDNYPRSYVYYLLKTDEFHNHALSYTNGTTVLHLNKNAISEFIYVIPSKQILDKFDMIANTILNKISTTNVTGIHALSYLRDTLLPKLMSGKIRIPLETR